MNELLNNETMKLSELIVTENGILKHEYCANLQWAGIVGIKDWSYKTHKQMWRVLKALDFVLIKDTEINFN